MDGSTFLFYVGSDSEPWSQQKLGKKIIIKLKMNNIFVTGMNNKERGEKGLGIGRLSLSND